MKKLLYILFFTSLPVVAQKTHFDSTDRIDDDQIYFFTQNMCPHCNHAATFIANKYPDLKIKYLEIDTHENREAMIACADKFNVNKRQLGTPLICMGQHYILGWSEEEEKKFDEYVKDFIEKD